MTKSKNQMRNMAEKKCVCVWGGCFGGMIIEAFVPSEAEGVTVGRREIKAYNCIIIAADT